MLITAEKMHKINVGCDSMADTKTPEERSKNMSHIRSTNTKPEELVRKYLFTHGFRYRKMINAILESQILYFRSIIR